MFKVTDKLKNNNFNTYMPGKGLTVLSLPDFNLFHCSADLFLSSLTQQYNSQLFFFFFNIKMLRSDVHLLPSTLYQETVPSICLIIVERAAVHLWIFMYYWIAGPGQIKIFITIFPAALILQQRTRGRSTAPISFTNWILYKTSITKGVFSTVLIPANMRKSHMKVDHQKTKPICSKFLP